MKKGANLLFPIQWILVFMGVIFPWGNAILELGDERVPWEAVGRLASNSFLLTGLTGILLGGSAVGGALMCMAIGLPRSIRLVLHVLAQLSWVIPSVVVAQLFLELGTSFFPHGLFTLPWAGLALGVGLFPWLLDRVLAAMEAVSPQELAAARSLGASRMSFIVESFLKGKTSLWLGPWMTVVGVMWTSYSVVALLGGGGANETLEVALIHELYSSRPNVNLVFVLAAVQMLGLGAMLWGTKAWMGRGKDIFLQPQDLELSQKLKWIYGILFFLTLGFLFWTHRSEEWIPAAFVSALLSGGVTLIVLIGVGATLAFPLTKWVRVHFLSVAWVSPAWFGVLCWKAYFPAEENRWLEWTLCVAVQVFLFLPIALWNLTPWIESLLVAPREAARSMGASRWRIFTDVEWPQLRGHFVRTGVLIFIASLSEVSSLLLFSRGEVQTLAIWVQDHLMRFKPELARDGSLVLLSIILLVMIVGEKYAGNSSPRVYRSSR